MRRWSIRTAQRGRAAQKILANCCKIRKRCHSAGKLVNWSEREDEDKTVGYCYMFICMQDSFFATVIPQIQICLRAIRIVLHATSDKITHWREHTEQHRGFKENLNLKTMLLSLKPSNTSSCIPGDVLTWNIYFQCCYKSYILTFRLQH